MLKTVNFRILRRCNAKCLMCNNWYDPNWSSKQFNKSEVVQILEEINSLGGRHVRINGGEPTLRKDLPEIINAATQMGLNTELVTNGSMLTKRHVQKLIKSGLNALAISIDYPKPEVHDRLREFKGLWKRAVNGVRYINKLSKGNVIVNVNAVITKHNYKQSFKMVELCKELCVNFLSFNQVDVLGQSTKRDVITDNDLRLNIIQMKEFYLKLVPKMLVLSPEDTMLFFNPFFTKLVNQDKQTILGELIKNSKEYLAEIDDFSKGLYGLSFYKNYKCYRLFTNLDIMADGGVYPCCNTLGLEDFKLGNIRKQNLKQILGSNKIKVIKDKIIKQRFEECYRCKNFFYENKTLNEKEVR